MKTPPTVARKTQDATPRRPRHGRSLTRPEGLLMVDGAEIRGASPSSRPSTTLPTRRARPAEDETEVALLRAIEELEWVLEERGGDTAFTG